MAVGWSPAGRYGWIKLERRAVERHEFRLVESVVDFSQMMFGHVCGTKAWAKDHSSGLRERGLSRRPGDGLLAVLDASRF
jgi:hypothetical protein